MRGIASFLRERPLTVLGILVILILGIREITGASGGNLTAEDRRLLAGLTATARYTATAAGIATATALVVQPVLDDRGVGDRETVSADYPVGVWTVGWAYNCGTLARPHFRLDLFDVRDTSYQHGKKVAQSSMPQATGWTPEEAGPTLVGQQFVLLETGPCAWHVRVMRGHRPVQTSMPAPDHT